jgi:hypothetical protein
MKMDDYCPCRALKQAGIGHHRPYDLRHTFASLLLTDGAPLPYVAAQLGHSNPTTTLQYYAHWLPMHGRRWVNVLDGPANALIVEPQQEPATFLGQFRPLHRGVVDRRKPSPYSSFDLPSFSGPTSHRPALCCSS